MGFFDFFRQPDIQEGLRQCQAAHGAVLLDVRTPLEYGQGRIPGSRDLPLGELERAAEVVPDRSTPLFVYCLSGARSSRAAALLRRMGYETVTNIGGISGYQGKVER